MISARHALLKRMPDGVFVEDLNSRNGTYVDGERISGGVLVRPGQEISLGSFRFQLLESGSLAKRDYSGNVTIEVKAVAVNAPNGDRLLDPVSLTIFPSELVALMGPAGAGKTTFLKALNGYTPPAQGSVLFNGADLYRHYDLFRQQLSYVPQDDIVHPQLTVREALFFSARLRTDLSDAEIEQRIDKILTSLGIQDKKETIIGSPERKVLSGGQRKRVNIAMELIADTPVIFLDEPTSGLSSYDAEGVIRLLKQLSNEGKTIITTIHQPSLDIFRQFDSLIMISRDRGGRGALAFFGPAHPDSLEFFNDSLQNQNSSPKELSPEILLSGLARRPTSDWIPIYEQSKYKRLFVLDRAGKIGPSPEEVSKSATRRFGLGQWLTLVRRNFILKVRDRAQSVILMIQAPFFALLLGVVFGRLKTPVNLANPIEWSKFSAQISGIEFLMVIGAIWFGCNNVARDIVGEWTVYQRERMVSLKLPSYVFSKLAIAMILALMQCLMLLGIVTLICGLKGNFLETLAVLYLASLAGSALGLCVSARASTTEAAIAMLPLILLPVITLGGGISPVNEMPVAVQQIAKVVPSRWAFEAAFTIEAAHQPQSLPVPGVPAKDVAYNQFPPSSRISLRASFFVLGAMLMVWLGLALISLRGRDVQ